MPINRDNNKTKRRTKYKVLQAENATKNRRPVNEFFIIKVYVVIIGFMCVFAFETFAGMCKEFVMKLRSEK